MSVKHQAKGQTRTYRHLVTHAFDLAHSLSIETVVVQTDRKDVIKTVDRRRAGERIIWIIRKIDGSSVNIGKQDIVVDMPSLQSSGLHQLRLGLFLAAVDGHLKREERVICLFRVRDASHPDALLLTKIEEYFPWFKKIDPARIRSVASPHIFAPVLKIARRLATEGREGKPIGTIFVLGRIEELEPHLRQLILNPCRGHSKKARNVLNPEFLETLRELSALDGALVISEKGVLESAGTYVSAPAGGARSAAGLGARHQAAAAISATGKAVAIAVSESSGTVTVFLQGVVAFELEK
jgi:DNA integrity scanning protein DisA with diadenylate cyclase activity